MKYNHSKKQLYIAIIFLLLISLISSVFVFLQKNVSTIEIAGIKIRNNSSISNNSKSTDTQNSSNYLSSSNAESLPSSSLPNSEKEIVIKFEQDKYTPEFISNLEKSDPIKYNDYYFNKYGLVILKNENYNSGKAEENYQKNQNEIQKLFYGQVPNFVGKNVEDLIDYLVKIKLIAHPDKRNANPEIIAREDTEEINKILESKAEEIILRSSFANISKYFYYKSGKVIALRGLVLDENLDYDSKKGWDFTINFTKENQANFQYYVVDRMKPESVIYFNFELGFFIHDTQYYSLYTSITSETDKLDLIYKVAQDVRLSQGNPNGKFENYPTTN